MLSRITSSTDPRFPVVLPLQQPFSNFRDKPWSGNIAPSPIRSLLNDLSYSPFRDNQRRISRISPHAFQPIFDDK